MIQSFLSAAGCLALVLISADGGPAQEKLPPSIERLRSDVRGKAPGEVHALLLQRFGKPSRELGSGLRLPEWDVEGGVLSYSPLAGVFFDGVQLIETHNRVAENLKGTWEVTSLPDPKAGGTRTWIGTIELSPNGTYRTTLAPSGRWFGTGFELFDKYPSGTYSVTYAPGVRGELLLETLNSKQVVVRLELRPSGGQDERVTAEVVAQPSVKQLEWTPLKGAPAPRAICSKDWEHRWD